MFQNSTYSASFSTEKYTKIYIKLNNYKKYIQINYNFLKIRSILLVLNYFLSFKLHNFFLLKLESVGNFFFYSNLIYILNFLEFNQKK